MKKLKLRFGISTGLLVLVLGANTSTKADLIQNTESFCIGGFQQPTVIYVPQFDPSKGRLTGAQIQISTDQYSISDEIAVFDTSTYPGAYVNVQVGASLSSSGPGFSLSESQEYDSTRYFQDNGRGYFANNASISTMTASIDASSLSFYSGNNYVSISLSYVPYTSGYLVDPGSWSGTITSTYNYSPFIAAPEPTTFFLPGMAAILGLCHTCRTRRAK